MPQTLYPLVMDEATDWSGQIISRRTPQFLFPGCVVRAVIKNQESGCAEAIYFRITKIKDGTFWGLAEETYRMSDAVGLPNGGEMTFRREHINEIPIDWQPKRFQRAVAHLKNGRKDRGYVMTGVRGYLD